MARYADDTRATAPQPGASVVPGEFWGRPVGRDVESVPLPREEQERVAEERAVLRNKRFERHFLRREDKRRRDADARKLRHEEEAEAREKDRKRAFLDRRNARKKKSKSKKKKKKKSKKKKKEEACVAVAVARAPPPRAMRLATAPHAESPRAATAHVTPACGLAR